MMLFLQISLSSFLFFMVVVVYFFCNDYFICE